MTPHGDNFTVAVGNKICQLLMFIVLSLMLNSVDNLIILIDWEEQQDKMYSILPAR